MVAFVFNNLKKMLTVFVLTALTLIFFAPADITQAFFMGFNKVFFTLIPGIILLMVIGVYLYFVSERD